MSGERLYDRIARLTITKMQVGVFVPLVGPSTITDVIEIGSPRESPPGAKNSGLRIAFAIDKSLDETPNTCTATVYNLAARTRALLQETPIHIHLEAGYDGVTDTIFSGDIRHVHHMHVGVEWVTRFQAGDGDRAFNFGRVQKSFRGGVDARAVVKELAGAMGLKVPKSADDVAALRGTFASGVALSGSASREMSRICKARGLTWSVQDGEMQVVDSGPVPDQEIIVSKATGLIGTPQFSIPKKPGQPPKLTLQTLLYPEISPGRVIRVQSAEIDGRFRVETVRHVGDTHQPENTTDIEAKEL